MHIKNPNLFNFLLDNVWMRQSFKYTNFSNGIDRNSIILNSEFDLLKCPHRLAFMIEHLGN